MGWAILRPGGGTAVLAPLTVFFAFYRKRRKPLFITAAVLGGIAVLALASDWLIMHRTHQPGGSGLRTVRYDATPSSLSPTQLVPEVDQLKLGSFVFQVLDPAINGKKAKRIRTLFGTVYDELSHDPDFAGAHCTLGYAYREMASGNHRSEHLFIYIPETTEPQMPVLLFVHGALGNFKGYAWVWKEFADRNGIALVAPTFCAGLFRDGGEGGFAIAHQVIANDKQLDENRILLAGLSNGGMGVSHAATTRDSSYRGLIYISPVLKKPSPQFLEKWRDRPVLVIHGTDDRRIPHELIAENVTLLREGGVDVDFLSYDGQDHFLMFDARERLLQDIDTWLKEDKLLQP